MNAQNVELVSQVEFARRVGVSQAAVSQAIGFGRIDKDPESGRINYTTEVVKWFKNRDDSKVHNPPGSMGGDEMAPSLAKAKLARETFTAKLRQLEYERESGKLVERNEVKVAMFKFGRVVREAVLNIPDRVAAETTARMVSYLKPILKKKLGKAMADEIISEIDQSQVERIAHEVWERESRAVLENIDEGPKL